MPVRYTEKLDFFEKWNAAGFTATQFIKRPASPARNPGTRHPAAQRKCPSLHFQNAIASPAAGISPSNPTRDCGRNIEKREVAEKFLTLPACGHISTPAMIVFAAHPDYPFRPSGDSIPAALKK